MTDLQGCFPCDFTENDDIKILLKERMQKIDSIKKEKFNPQEVCCFFLKTKIKF